MQTEAKKTILVVDDSQINRKILSVILSEKYYVIEADNGLSAEEQLNNSERKISLILLDIVMPVMDGFTFLRKMQQNKKFKDIPVIFVTSETYEENVLEGIKMGVRDVIAKPYSPELVLKRADNLILISEKLENEAAEEETVTPKSLALLERKKSDKNMALIVDDVSINRLIIRNALESEYGILEAENGQEALDLLIKHRDAIAVVLLDIIMPVMDGYEMLKEAQKTRLLDGIPVIAITAEEILSKLDILMELGICEVIQKPFTPSVIRNRVDYMIEIG